MKALFVGALCAVSLVPVTCGADTASSLNHARSVLRCGMTVADVRTKTSVGELRDNAAGGWRLRRGDTDVLLTFTNEGLKEIQVQQRHRGTTRIDFSPIENLCDGSRSGVLVVSAPSALSGATVRVDGADAGSLTPTAIRLTVAWRAHEVRVTKAGWQPIVKRVRFNDQSGFARVDLTPSDVVPATGR